MGGFFIRFLKIVCALTATVVIAGVVSYPFAKNARRFDTQRDIGTASSIRAATGAGALFAVLGGYRTLAADLAWIKSYIYWEKRDLSGCISSMELATDIDPYALNFWYQASGIIAFDTPYWIFEKNPVRAKSVEFQKAIKARQAKLAISYIDRALKIFPNSDKLYVRKGQIAMILDDWKLAGDCFSVPASKPNALFYSRRIYAAMLAKQGKYAESLVIFEKLYADTEDDSPLKSVFKEEIEKLRQIMKKTSLKGTDKSESSN